MRTLYILAKIELQEETDDGEDIVDEMRKKLRHYLEKEMDIYVTADGENDDSFSVEFVE